MRKFLHLYQLFLLLFVSNNCFSQLLPNYYPILESNKGLGNKQLSYNLYSVTSGTASPIDSAGFDTYIKGGVLQKYGATSLAVEKGTINTTSTTQYNVLNWNSTTQLQNAVFSGVSPYAGFADYFAIIVSGYFIPKETGTYLFTIEADDNDELVINNKIVVSQYVSGGHGPSAIGTHTGSITLTAGVKYQFRVRMQETAVGEQLNVFWQKPSEQSAGAWYQDAEELSSINIINNGLVQKLDFNNLYSYPLTGTKVYDILNNQHGTITGPTFNSKLNSLPSGNLYFNGNGQYIDFGTSPTNFPTGDISASVWINFSQLNNSSWNIFMTKWFNGINGGSSDFHYSVKYNGTNYKQNLYTTNTSDVYGSTIINPNSWYNLGFTLTNGVALQLYLNGLPDGNVVNLVSRTNGTSNYYLGDPRPGSLLCFTGYLGDVSIYNRALTQSEMLSNYNATKNNFAGIVQDGLKMNLINPPSSGITWTDISGNGNNATLNGSPTYTSANGGGYTTSSSSYISTNYNLGSSYTISLASSFNPTSYWATLWGNESWTVSKGYIAYLGSSSTINFGSPSGVTSISVTGINTVHIWDFVVTGTNYTLYKDGVSLSTGTLTAPSGGVSTNGLYFGARHANNGSSYTDACPGTYYSMRVYNRALSADEINTNFSFLRSSYGL